VHPVRNPRLHQGEAPSQRAGAALLAASLLAALAATWPLILAPGEMVARGTEFTATPTLHDLWTLWWVAERAAHGFRDFWNAPIFHPQQGAFAYSDPLILLGLISSPLWWSGLPPAISYNATLIAVLALNGVCAGRLVLALGGGRLAATLGAVLATTLPVTAKMAGVLTVLSFFGLLLAIEGLVRFSRHGSRAAAGGAAAGCLIQFFTSEQIALLGIPFLLLAVAAALAGQGFSWSATRRLALAFAIAGSAALLIVLPIIGKHRTPGFRRSEAVVAIGSARTADFLTRPFSSPFSIPPRETLERDSSGLFPGFILLLLATVGALDGLRVRRRWTLVLIVAAAAAATMALGLNANLGGWRPFASLRAMVPGLEGIRSPFRSALIFQAILAVLGALGLDAAARWSPARAWRAAVLGIAVLGAVENLCVPAPLLPLPRTPRTAWSSWLRSQPPGTTVIAHLPLPGSDATAAFETETWRMFRQIDHRQPMLNGYAAFFPPVYDALQKLLNEEFPDYRSLCALHELAGVDTVVVDRRWVDDNPSRFAGPEVRRLLLPVYQDGAVAIFRLRPTPADCRPDSGAPGS
jgi:hypothetical protein